MYEKQWDHIPLDSFALLGTRFFVYKSFSAAYDGLKSNGRLAIIENEELRNKVVFYFEDQKQHLIDWSEWHRNFVTNTLEPYMFNELPINPQELIDDVDYLKKQLETMRLNSLISNQIGSLRRINEQRSEHLRR